MDVDEVIEVDVQDSYISTHITCIHISHIYIYAYMHILYIYIDTYIIYMHTCRLNHLHLIFNNLGLIKFYSTVILGRVSMSMEESQNWWSLKSSFWTPTVSVSHVGPCLGHRPLKLPTCPTFDTSPAAMAAPIRLLPTAGCYGDAIAASYQAQGARRR